MMGNIRFIGELYKKGIIKIKTMHECIHELLTSKTIDEQELELVCKLLRTVGEKMEQNTTEDQSRAFDSYFVKLSELSKEKKFNVRTRFFIEEIINLRQNNWQERRVADGPALLEDIRSKVANEEQMRKQANTTVRHGRGRGYPGRGAPQLIPDPRVNTSRQVVNNSIPSTTIIPSSSISSSNFASSTSSLLSNNQPIPNQRRPSFPTATPETRQRSNSSDSPASMKGSVENQEREQLSEEAIYRRVKSIVEEYLNIKDVSEAGECLLELPESAYGQFVNFIISKFLDCGKLEIRNDLIMLIRAVMSSLSPAREYIEESIANCEPLIFLVDSIMDIKQVSNYYYIIE